MNRIIYFLIILTLSCEIGDEPIEYNEIELKPFIINNYTDDAKQLYMHEIFNNVNHSNYDNPELDNNEVDKILKIIQLVYDSNSVARDSVFDIHKIHARYCYSFNSIMLKVNAELPEIKKLSNNIFPTGNADLDKILSKYKIDSVKTAYSYPKFNWLTVYTKNEYNVMPIANELDNLSSILIADFNKGCVGGGNTINLHRNDSMATITFSIGWGDCPAGCIYHKYWEFKVTNKRAEFIRSY